MDRIMNVLSHFSMLRPKGTLSDEHVNEIIAAQNEVEKSSDRLTERLEAMSEHDDPFEAFATAARRSRLNSGKTK